MEKHLFSVKKLLSHSIIVLIVSVSCYTTNQNLEMQFYQGDPKPKDEIAIITIPKLVRCKAIDGVKASRKYYGFSHLTHRYNDVIIEIEPGVHTFVLFYKSQDTMFGHNGLYDVKSVGDDIKLSIFLEPGHEYTVHSSMQKPRSWPLIPEYNFLLQDYINNAGSYSIYIMDNNNDLCVYPPEGIFDWLLFLGYYVVDNENYEIYSQEIQKLFVGSWSKEDSTDIADKKSLSFYEDNSCNYYGIPGNWNLSNIKTVLSLDNSTYTIGPITQDIISSFDTLSSRGIICDLTIGFANESLQEKQYEIVFFSKDRFYIYDRPSREEIVGYIMKKRKYFMNRTVRSVLLRK
jgi:hypothetical protein